MFAEEETELRDIIIQNLENCGFLNKIKAELRAGVFLALEEEGSLKNKIPLFNRTFDDFCGTVEGKLAVSIVREFLEFFNLNFTLSVFDPEIACDAPHLTRAELCDRLKLNVTENDSIISILLKDKIPQENEKVNASSFTLNLNSDLVKGYTHSGSTENVKDNFLSNKTCASDLPKKEIAPVYEGLESQKQLTSINLVRGSGNGKKKMVDELDPKRKPKVENTSRKIESSGFDDKNSDLFGKEKSSSIFLDSADVSTLDHDSFFDEPLPAVKSSYFNYHSETTGIDLKDDSHGNLSGIKTDPSTIDKNSLTSLKDLPSLASNEWTFSKDLKNSLPSLDSLKSISSSENSNEEIINLDAGASLNKKDTDVTMSNEDFSDRQNNSEESIEEEIEEDFSAGLDDLLNSSMSLADDATTDQTVSQVSIIDGVDHVEPCNSVN